jgi:hypothetical protein
VLFKALDEFEERVFLAGRSVDRLGLNHDVNQSPGLRPPIPIMGS